MLGWLPFFQRPRRNSSSSSKMGQCGSTPAADPHTCGPSNQGGSKGWASRHRGRRAAVAPRCSAVAAAAATLPCRPAAVPCTVIVFRATIPTWLSIQDEEDAHPMFSPCRRTPPQQARRRQRLCPRQSVPPGGRCYHQGCRGPAAQLAGDCSRPLITERGARGERNAEEWGGQ